MRFLIAQGIVALSQYSPYPEYCEHLRDRHVVILADNDAAGRKHAEQVAAMLQGIAASVRVLHLPGLPEKGDVSDWLDSGGDAEKLLALARATAEWKPAPNGATETRTATESSATKSNLWTPAGRTDLANAERLFTIHGADVRWCDPWAKWLIWDGRRWAIDKTRLIETLAGDVCRMIWRGVAEAGERDNAKLLTELVRFAKSTAGGNGIRHMIGLARSIPGVPIVPDELDRNPWLLNVRNGTIDLQTGALRSHRKADLLSKMAPVDFDGNAACPSWHDLLSCVTCGNADLIDFLQRVVGYTITGQTSEHILPFCYGTGANGKSTFIGGLLELLGPDYAIKAASDLLLAKKGAHPTEVADLHGRRFVAAVEAEDGRRLAESLVKELTGGDNIRARRMREDFWEFTATHTIWLAANHKPIIKGTDHGIWRRVKLIPFTMTIPDAEQDKRLPEKLRGELPGILNWAIEGCLTWQRDGLAEPEDVAAATTDYRAEMDVIGAFIDDRCILAANAAVQASLLYKSYQKWTEENGERPINQRRFGTALNERGLGKERRRDGIHRTGIGILSSECEPCEPS